MEGKIGELRVGTSGWSNRHWREVFYPKGVPQRRWLEHYATVFDSVEYNGSFYRLPRNEIVRRWLEMTPESFRFSLKAPRQITHFRKLETGLPALRDFLSVAEILGSRCGPLLFQCPPKLNLSLEQFRSFLDELPDSCRYTFELRDPRWHTDEVLSLLENKGAAFCIYDLEGRTSETRVTAPFAYIRLHGPEEKYASRYTDTQIAEWAGWIRNRRAQGIETWVYFDNTAKETHAIENARSLRERVRLQDG